MTVSILPDAARVTHKIVENISYLSIVSGKRATIYGNIKCI